MTRFKSIGLILLCALFIFGTCGTGMAETIKDDRAVTVGGGRATYKIHDEDDMTSDSDTGLATQQSIKKYVDTGGAVVVIDGLDDLTAASDVTGASSFQTVAGKTYFVDLNAIARYGTAGGTTAWPVGGVSAFMANATADTDKDTVTIVWAVTGNVVGGSGASNIYVYPAPSSGITSYGESAKGTYDGTFQNMTGMATSGVSTVTVIAASATGSKNIDAYGDTCTWRLFYNSAVSAQMVNRYMP